MDQSHRYIHMLKIRMRFICEANEEKTQNTTLNMSAKRLSNAGKDLNTRHSKEQVNMTSIQYVHRF